MTARLHQFAKSLGIGIDVLEQFVARQFPALQPALKLPDVGVAQRRKLFGRHGHEAFAGIIGYDRHILARQPCCGFERDPVGGHVGGKQRMTGSEHGLVPDIEQGDFIAQQQGGSDLAGGDGWQGHDWISCLGSFFLDSSIGDGTSSRTRTLTLLSSLH